MANITSQQAGSANSLAAGTSNVRVVKHSIDIADTVTAGIATGEYTTVFTFPADVYMKILQIEVTTACSLGSSPRIDVGDATDDDEYVTNASTLTAGTILTLTADNEKYQSAASEVRLKITGGTIATGVIHFTLMVADISPIVNAKVPTYTN